MSARSLCAIAVGIVAMAVTVPVVHAQPRPGMGSLGAHLGVPYFVADQDMRTGERPRVLGQFHFQYKATPRWRFSTEFGYGWVGYNNARAPYKLLNPATGDSVSTKEDVLAKFQPITATALYSLRPNATKWSPYVGGGLNLTRLEIVNRRKKIQDPATFDLWVKWSLGVQAEVGTELYLQSNHSVSLDWMLRVDHQFSKDTVHFPSGFTGSDSYAALNFGVNVYFWPGGKKPIEIAPAPTAAPSPTPAPPAVPEATAPPAPAPPDTTHAPAPPDTTHVPAPSTPAPPTPSPAAPDTTHVPAPAPAPAAADTTHVPPPAPVPPAPTPPPTPVPPTPTPAPPDTTKPGGHLPPAASSSSEPTFGAFGVPVPAVDPDPAVCPAPALPAQPAAPAPAAPGTPPRREELVEPR